MSVSQKKQRSHETQVIIEASPEDVWKALTDPDELMNWFPLKAHVRPGVGGSIGTSWGDEFTGECPIHVWEPGVHLRTGWPAFGVPEEEAAHLAVDYTLEAKGGRTTLSLVHSGFGDGPAWEKEYDGTRRGWGYELKSLRHYLERHRGRKRHVAWAKIPIDRSMTDSWSRLMGAEGLGGEGSLAGLREGDRYAITTALGQRLEGILLTVRPPTDFAATVENLDDSLLRAGIEDCFDPPVAAVWLSAWRLPEADVRAFELSWNEQLARLYPGGP